MPLLPKLGPKYGPKVADIRKAVAAGDVEPLDGGRIRVGEFELERDEYEHRSQAGEGYAVAEDAEWVVAVSTVLDEELIREGTARECVRFLQQARKDLGLDISDRIRVRWEASGMLADALTAHADVIADEVLAVEMNSGELDHDTPDEATRSYTVGEETAWIRLERVSS
jgi:isoleucyl-tRNA synthetase